MENIGQLFASAALGDGWVVPRLLLAATLGGLIGLEREKSGKPAGFRTNLLICVGAALLTELSFAVAASPAGRAAPAADPGRIAAQIVSGVGFLGAGTIIQARGGVRGLTTAATLWVVAAIGMAVGSHAYIEAIGATGVVIIALLVLGRVELRMIEQDDTRLLVIELGHDAGVLARVQDALSDAGVQADRQDVVVTDESMTASFRCRADDRALTVLMQKIVAQPGVRRLSLT